MKYVLIISIIILTLISCGKKVTLKGRVYNPIDNKGIEGIDIQIAREKINFFSYDGAGSNIIENTTTDKDGNYLINYRHKSRSHRLFFAIDKDKYINVEPVQYNISQKNQTIDLPLVPVGNLAVNIINADCFDENDKFVVYRTHKDLPEYFTSSTGTYHGCHEHYGNTNKVMMGWHLYTGTVTKNNIETPFKDSIYVSAGGNHVWHIEY